MTVKTISYLLLILLVLEYLAISSIAQSDIGWRYGDLAYTKCKAKETKDLKGVCARIQEVVEEAFDEQGLALQNAFGNAYSEATKTAMKPPFSSMGEKMLDDYLSWVFSHKVKKQETLKNEFIQRFFKWFAEVLKEVDIPGSGGRTLDIPEDGFIKL